MNVTSIKILEPLQLWKKKILSKFLKCFFICDIFTQSIWSTRKCVELKCMSQSVVCVSLVFLDSLWKKISTTTTRRQEKTNTLAKKQDSPWSNVQFYICFSLFQNLSSSDCAHFKRMLNNLNSIKMSCHM